MYIGCNFTKESLLSVLTNNTTITAFQVFLSPNISYSLGKSFSNEVCLKIKDLMLRKGIYGVVHGKYLYNFSKTDNSISVKTLIGEMKLASEIDCNIIIHQGKNVDKLDYNTAIDNYVSGIRQVLNANHNLNNKIVLENSARQGTELGYSIDQLYDIYTRFSESEKLRIMFCIDTCHLFVSGELDCSDDVKTREFFEKFETKIGKNKIECIHLNDSAVEFNGKNDHHDDIGHGFIGKKSMSGFKYIKEYAEINNIAIILETPGTKESCHSQIIKFMEL